MKQAKDLMKWMKRKPEEKEQTNNLVPTNTQVQCASINCTPVEICIPPAEEVTSKCFTAAACVNGSTGF